jgi:alkanesulfonate monooxygenase SsuD/methylene tetrahydromethanopterin reductase-like flavin-dependent oxidoreductase (luciferase family)
MKLSVFIFATDEPIEPTVLAQAAKQRGFESLLVPEHTHIPVRGTGVKALEQGRCVSAPPTASPDEVLTELDQLAELVPRWSDAAA